MKRRYVILCPLLVAMLLAGCGSSRNAQDNSVSTIAWQPDTLTVDGNDGDWQQPLPYADTKRAFSYGFSNDSNYLYIRALAQDERIILSVLKAGMTVYINTHGVKETAGAAGISFPTGNRGRRDGNMLNDRPELQQDKRLALQQLVDYVLFGFPGIKTPETFDYPQTNPEGVEVAAGLNPQGALVYEARIPLAALGQRVHSLAVGMELQQLPGSGNGGGGGISIGGGLGFGSFGRGGGVGVSVGSGSLGTIGGRKNGKPLKYWHEIVLSKRVAAR